MSLNIKNIKYGDKLSWINGAGEVIEAEVIEADNGEKCVATLAADFYPVQHLLNVNDTVELVQEPKAATFAAMKVVINMKAKDLIKILEQNPEQTVYINRIDIAYPLEKVQQFENKSDKKVNFLLEPDSVNPKFFPLNIIE